MSLVTTNSKATVKLIEFFNPRQDSNFELNDIEEMSRFAENLILTKTGKSLSFIQKVILQETLSKTEKNYAQIAQENSYSETYIKQWVAPKLWQQLSASLGEKVNKTNCVALLSKKLASASFSPTKLDKKLDKIPLESPEGQVPLASSFYVERPSIEHLCYQEILQPGALLQIQGPRKIGKTSLLARILAYGEKQNYCVVQLNLHLAETEIFTSITKFLRWVCANVTQQLKLDSQLDQYWKQDIGALVNCTLYFQSYILAESAGPIILAFDEVDQIFKYPNIAHDFLALLHSWHGAAKDTPAWKKLRLVVIHATDIHACLKNNPSPFSVGSIVDLPAFTQAQIADLAKRHGIPVSSSECEAISRLTGGFPYLVRLMFHQSAYHNASLSELLSNAANDQGIFSQHLHNLLWKLCRNSRLLETFKRILNSAIELELEEVLELESLGLVRLEGNKARVSCQLYQEYFSAQFCEVISASI